MKIGILGLGSIGKRHAANLLKLGHEVIGYDPDPVACDVLSNIGGDVLLRRESVLEQSDAIIVASPTSQHLQDLADIAVAGKKPTFLEKPVGHKMLWTVPDFVKMVGCNLRFHAAVKKAKEWMPRIGKPLWAHFCVAQFNEKPVYRRDGVILNWGAHEVDLALYLLGPGHCSSASKDEAESIADINITHDSGCMSTVHLDYLTNPEQRFFCIVGGRGTLRASLAPQRYTFCSDVDDTFFAFDSYDENYVEEMQAFIDRLEGKETLGATVEDGLAALQILMDAKTGEWQA